MHQDPAGLLRACRRRGAVGSPTAGLRPGPGLGRGRSIMNVRLLLLLRL